jgi:hypothetical protein
MGLCFIADFLSDLLPYTYCTVTDVIPFTCMSIPFPYARTCRSNEYFV